MTGRDDSPVEPCMASCPQGECANCIGFDRPSARAHLPAAPMQPDKPARSAKAKRKTPPAKRAAELTIKDLRDRSDEVGQCWLWKLNCNSAGYPMVSYHGQSTLVRRLAYVLAWDARGMVGPLPSGRRHNVVAECGQKRCCNPACLRLQSRSEIVRRSFVETRRTDLEYAARCAARVRQGSTKLGGLQQAREIRADSRPAHVVADELGVSASLVQKIRQGRIWRESVANNSVFSWRPAA